MTAIQQWLATVRDVPRIECEVLLSELLNLSRAQILAFPERELAAGEQQRLEANIEALRGGMPLAYILGSREFWGLSFKVTSAVLIPRPETELLVELTAELAPQAGRVLDLGTGSGAIAIAVASERPDLTITAVDVSSAALAIAEENASTHNMTIDCILSNWFENLSGQWDIIVANPPYIAADDPHLAFLQAEPQQALVARENGMRDICKIVADSRHYLRPGGHLIIEHGYDQAGAVRAVMQRTGFYNVGSAKDLAGIERASIGYMDPTTSG